MRRPDTDALLASLFKGSNHANPFDAIVCAEQSQPENASPTTAHTPHQLVCKQMSCDSSQVIAFEDSAQGLRMARKAGIATVVVPSRYQPADNASYRGASLIVDNLDGPVSMPSGTEACVDIAVLVHLLSDNDRGADPGRELTEDFRRVATDKHRLPDVSLAH